MTQLASSLMQQLLAIDFEKLSVCLFNDDAKFHIKVFCMEDFNYISRRRGHFEAKHFRLAPPAVVKINRNGTAKTETEEVVRKDSCSCPL